MTNDMIVSDSITPAMQEIRTPASPRQPRYYPAYDEARAGKLVDEVIAAVKDDRANTKRAISADIAATARVQNQNERIIAACEHELRRRDLSDDRRAELIAIMDRAAESTAYESAASRAFQEKQLDHSHKLPWKILGWGVAILFGGIGGAALLRAAA